MRSANTILEVSLDRKVIKYQNAAETVVEVFRGLILGFGFGLDEVIAAENPPRGKQRLIGVSLNDFGDTARRGNVRFYPELGCYISRDWSNQKRKEFLDEIAKNLEILGSMFVKIVGKGE